MATERDWTELRQELLHLIAKKLGNLSNFIRFRSVCKPWRAAADPADPPPQLPWILQPATLSLTNSDTKTDYFIYSLSSHSASKIKLPVNHREFKFHGVKEPSIGFIFAHVIDHHRIRHPFLCNPLTGTKIHLPFAYVRDSFLYMGPSNNSKSSKVKPGVHLLVYTELWDGQTEIRSWISDTNEFFTFKVPLDAFVVGCYKEKVFVCEFRGSQTSVFDLTTGVKINVVIPHPADCPHFDYFVEAMGDLLALPDQYRDERGGNNRQFKVYRLEHTDDFGQCKWIKLNGIGERVLFLGKNGGFCLNASDFEGLKGNCIYYMQQCVRRNKNGDLCYNRVLRYDMANGTSDELLNRVPVSATWFLPCLSWS